MSKHTPGPWKFREYALDDQMLAEARALGMEPIRFINNDGSVPVTAADSRICTVDCQTDFKRGTGHKAECAERDANARLIAAAPDLLPISKAVAALYFPPDAADDTPIFGTNGAYITVGDVKSARAAIAKAEGRT